MNYARIVLIGVILSVLLISVCLIGYSICANEREERCAANIHEKHMLTVKNVLHETIGKSTPVYVLGNEGGVVVVGIAHRNNTKIIGVSMEEIKPFQYGRIELLPE